MMPIKFYLPASSLKHPPQTLSDIYGELENERMTPEEENNLRRIEEEDAWYEHQQELELLNWENEH